MRQVVTDTTASMMDMESLGPRRRGCRFPWEVEELTFHSTYSLATCRCTHHLHLPRLECGLKEAMEREGCVPWFLPQSPGHPNCRYQPAH